MTNKQFALLVALSALTSAVVSLLVMLVAGVGVFSRAEPSSLPGTDDVGGLEAPAIPPPKPMPADEVPTRQVVKQLWDEVQALKTKKAVDDVKEKGARALAELLASPAPNHAMAAHAINLLIRGGDASVDSIVASLESGKDVDFGGGMSWTGNTITAYPSLRMALLYALYQIGTPASRDACFGHLAQGSGFTTTSRFLMFIQRQRLDEQWVGPVKEAVTKAFNEIARMPPQEVADTKHVTSTLMHLGMWIERYAIQECQPLLLDILKDNKLDGGGVDALLEGVAATSPDVAAREYASWLESPKCDRKRAVILLASSRAISLPTHLELLRRIDGLNVLTKAEYLRIFKYLSHIHRTYGRYPERPAKEIREHLKVLIAYLHERQALASDPDLAKAIAACIEEIEKAVR